MNRILVSTGLYAAFALALAACGSATTTPDGGEDSGSYLTGPDDAGDGAAPGDSGGDAADSQPVCVIPASATIPLPGEGGTQGCQPNRSAPFNCTGVGVTTFKLACTADIPSDIPPPPSALGCSLASNVTVEPALFYCCPCGM
jgi:hypothetical protein